MARCPSSSKLISNRLVGPTLGEEAISASLEAGIIGLILTGLFIILVYRLVGAMATIALASYALLAYAMLLALGSTLTLPGLAGFVLAIGMAIDANVLVFERAREEYAAYPSAGLRRALAVGFNKAWSAILDSNVTTLLAAGLLFVLGSGPIKGFGVTLSIGVIASMISALVIARVLSELAVSTKAVVPPSRHQRPRQHRPGPHVAGPQEPRHHEQAQDVARHLRGGHGAGRRPASSPRASTSVSSSPAAASSTTR